MPVARKINLAKPNKVEATVAALPPASKAKLAKIVAEAEPKVVVAKAVKAPRVVVARPTHELVSLYQGPSTGLNKRKSVTALDHSKFGTAPDYVLTARTESVLNTLRGKYGTNPFQRMNADAGVMKYAITKGVIQPVTGDGTKETDTYRFVAPKAVAAAPKAKKAA